MDTSTSVSLDVMMAILLKPCYSAVVLWLAACENREDSKAEAVL